MDLKARLNKVILLNSDENHFVIYEQCKETIRRAQKAGEIKGNEYDSCIDYIKEVMKI